MLSLKPHSSNTLGRYAIILAVVIAVVNLTNYLSWQLHQFTGVRSVINFLFPDEIFVRLRSLTFGNLPHAANALRNFPFFTVLLSVLLIVGAKRLQQHKTWLLIACYCVLVFSTLTAIPDLVDAYRFALEQYTQYQSQPHHTTGILGLLDAFAYTEKPSMPLYILKGLILAGYAAWSAWQIMLLNKLRKEQRRPAVAIG